MAKPTESNIYGYNASKAAANTFAVLNFLLLLAHAYLSIYLPCRKKTVYKHRYTIPLFVACVLATSGYSVRIASIHQPSDVALYATSSSYVVLSPIFVCATLYWQLAYMIMLLLPTKPPTSIHTPPPRKSPQYLYKIPPRFLGRLFIASDITSFLTQASGSGIASSGNWEGNLKDIGTNVLIAGLVLQLVTFTFYLVFLGTLVRRIKTTPTATCTPNARMVFIGIFIAAVFVQVRSTCKSHFVPQFLPDTTCPQPKINISAGVYTDPHHFQTHRVRTRYRRLPLLARMVSVRL
jgi:hypothetical protein